MVKTKAFAKLNLNLHILPKKFTNGYFQVQFLNCQLDLHDELVFKEKKHAIEIVCEHPQVPLDNNNLIYKAAKLLKKAVYREDLGVRIILKKNIPVKAGLGGGSADAAATIKGLSQLWQIKLNQQELLQLAGNLGKDVYYCLQGRACEVKGDGSEVVPLNTKIAKLWLIIITPEIEKPSTAWMYQHLITHKIGQNIHKFEKLKTALINKSKKGIIKNLFNDFEASVISNFPIVAKVKEDLKNYGANNTLLAGSGLSVVGFFTEKIYRDQDYQKLKNIYKRIISTKTR